jgi:hypothetical protein
MPRPELDNRRQAAGPFARRLFSNAAIMNEILIARFCCRYARVRGEALTFTVKK